ncbi:MAG: hypothetical protein WDM78_07105 [Puia sp.]
MSSTWIRMCCVLKPRIGTYTLPTSYGFGFSITRDKKYTLVGDYKFQNWSSLRSTTGDFFYENSQRASHWIRDLQ